MQTTSESNSTAHHARRGRGFPTPGDHLVEDGNYMEKGTEMDHKLLQGNRNKSAERRSVPNANRTLYHADTSTGHHKMGNQ